MNVNHFATGIIWKVSYPAFAEYSWLQIYFLIGDDSLFKFVQWTALIIAILATTLIAKRFGGNKQVQLITALLVVSIPSGIIQVSALKNDLLLAAILMVYIVFLLRFVQDPVNYLMSTLVGAVLGILIFTKGSAFLFAFPVTIWSGYKILLKRGWRNKQILQSILTVGIIAVTINLGHFSRNIHTFGNPVGKGGEHTINELISLEGLLSNIVRGIQTHMPRSKNKYPEILNFAINGTTGILWRVHQFTGLDVRDVRTTLNQKYYFFESPRPRGRDISHVLLIIISFLILTYRLIRKTDRDISTYFIITFITYILFSLLLKTHPSTARFQLTLFFLWSPLISLTLFRLANTPWNIVKFGIILIVWVLSLPTLVKNHINPLFPYNDSLVAGQPSRSLATYFLKKKTAYSNFEAMTTMISNNSCNKIAIDTYKLEDFYDYPFRIMLFEKGYEGTIEFIRVENETKIYENLDFSPCIVISKVDDYENFTNIPPVKFDEFNVMLIEGP